MNGLTEVHYAGHGKRPARIWAEESATYFLMMKEDEIKYGANVNDSKYTSFVFKNKGVGVYQIGDYLYLGIRLYGVHTLMMVNEDWGGKHACIDFASFNIPSDIDWSTRVVGNLVEMVTLTSDHLSKLSDYAKKCIAENFEKVLEKANTAFTRHFNPDQIDQDLENSIRAMLKAAL